MDLHSVLWIEDDEGIVDKILNNFSEDKEERGYNLMPHHFKSLKDFGENSEYDLSLISMELVCIDYNLPEGINGDEIIFTIRSYQANKDIPIIFYSFAKNEVELQAILKKELDDLSNIYYAHQDDLEDRMILLIES